MARHYAKLLIGTKWRLTFLGIRTPRFNGVATFFERAKINPKK